MFIAGSKVLGIQCAFTDAATMVDIQEALLRAYDRPVQEHFIYRDEPEPSLAATDAPWARLFVPTRTH
jgi:hypothetical protein